MLARNLRVVGSELDLVAVKGGTLIIVEVKARRSRLVDGISADQLLPPRKRRALQRGAEAFLARSGAAYVTVRFDLAIVYPGARVEYHVGVLG